jgi:polar amino acid transport system permease protein
VYWKKKRISPLDYAVTFFLLLLAGYIFYRLTVRLNYKWQWDIIPSYLFRYNPDQARWEPNLLLEGLFTTMRLSILATVLASLIGLAMGLMRASRRLLLRLLAATYVELIRNTPPLVLVFIFYFFVSSQILPLLGVEQFARSLSPPAADRLAFFLAAPSRLLPFLSGMLTIALFQGAYIAEIIRAGIQSIEKGQWEASYALGLSRFQQMIHVILPQAARRILPSLANEFINTIKYSSIVSIISIQELTFQGMQIMASTRLTFEIWLTVTFMYFSLCLLLSLGVRRLENRFAGLPR